MHNTPQNIIKDSSQQFINKVKRDKCILKFLSLFIIKLTKKTRSNRNYFLFYEVDLLFQDSYQDDISIFGDIPISLAKYSFKNLYCL